MQDGTTARRHLRVLLAFLLVIPSVASLALPAVAVNDLGLFELEADAIDAGGEPGDDWSPFAQSAVEKAFFVDGAGSNFTGGGSKIENGIGQWSWGSTPAPPDKNDLLDAFAAAYVNQGDLVVYFGGDRFDTSGDSGFGFWFFKEPVSARPDGTFSGRHVPGDILVISEFTNGGSVSTIKLYEWVGDDATGSPSLVLTGQECNGAGNNMCGIVNTTVQTAPWSYTDKAGNSDFQPGAFFEGGVNLSALLGGEVCFANIMAITASSQETTSQMKDFVLGAPSDFSTCSMNVQKSADPVAVDEPGDDVTFSVTVQNTSLTAALTIDSLEDDVFGDLTGLLGSTCTVPFTVAAGSATTCSFTAPVTGDPGYVHLNTVTATGAYTDGTPAQDSDDATVNVVDVASAIDVAKTANPIEVAEPGGPVTFSVVVANSSLVDLVTIDTLVDDIHGDLDGAGDCSVPQAIEPGGSYACSFDAFVAGGPGEMEIDVVTASGSDDDGNPVSASAEATVTITDVPSAIEVIKVAEPAALAEPGGIATFTVTVNNLSAVDAVTIEGLVDDPYGDVTAIDGSTCLVPQTLPAGGTYTCTFDQPIDGDAGDVLTDVVTATGIDDDQVPVEASDDATVTIVNTKPLIEVQKSASVSEVSEPGGQVTFVVSVRNLSPADTVTLETMLDDVFGDLTALPGSTCSVPKTLFVAGQEGDSYECSFAGLVVGQPGDVHINTVSVTGTDEDGDAVADTDDATVSFGDVDAAIEVVKTADPAEVLEPGGMVTFSVFVSNQSEVDDVTITTLTDSEYGDLNGVGTCAVPFSLTPGGLYGCSFVELVEGQPGDAPHRNVVTADGVDDDQNPVSDSDDATVGFDDADSAIQVVKTADPTTIVAPGGAVTFSVSVANLSVADEVTITSLTDDIHGDLDGLGSCTVPQTIQVGGLYECSFTVTVAGTGGSETDVVTAAGVDDDGNPVGDSDDATVVITPPAVEDLDLAVDKIGPADPVDEGDRVVYTITVTNQGPLTEPNAVAVDTLPDSFLFVSAQPSQGTCSELTGLVTCRLGALAPDDNATISVVVDTTKFGTYTNSVVVAGDVLDQDPSNNRAEVDTDVIAVLPQIITTTTTTTPETLPFTGASGAGVAGSGVALVLLGLMMLLAIRTREESA
jgi:uncharacterized repeat protein (TIGR01451 family)